MTTRRSVGIRSSRLYRWSKACKLTIAITSVLLISSIIACTSITYNVETGRITLSDTDSIMPAPPGPSHGAADDIPIQPTNAPIPPSATIPSRDDSSTPTGTPLPSPISAPVEFIAADHYWFERPIESGKRNYVSRFYPYGSTYRSRYQVHHGVEFENPTGTPILAVGAGSVLVAGPDNPTVYGRFRDFYGLLVVIQHDRSHFGRTLYTLYGHLHSVNVKVGDIVETGTVVGTVGETGVALGPHLHMEVRLGENSYAATRNPELWIKPFEKYGSIAGRLERPDGTAIQQDLITLYNGDGSWRTETETYGEGTNSDEGWNENFVFGDVPVGKYVVQYVIDNTIYAEEIEVESQRTSFVSLTLQDESE